MELVRVQILLKLNEYLDEMWPLSTMLSYIKFLGEILKNISLLRSWRPSEVDEIKIGCSGWNFRCIQSVMKILKRTTSTSLLNSHFQTIVKGQSEYTWQMWCVVLFFFGRWNVFVHFASGLFCFSWRNKDNNWSMCSASGMSYNLGVQEVHNTRSSKGKCFGSTPSTPQFHQIVCTLQCIVVSDSLKINHLSVVTPVDQHDNWIR